MKTKPAQIRLVRLREHVLVLVLAAVLAIISAVVGQPVVVFR